MLLEMGTRFASIKVYGKIIFNDGTFPPFVAFRTSVPGSVANQAIYSHHEASIPTFTVTLLTTNISLNRSKTFPWVSCDGICWVQRLILTHRRFLHSLLNCYSELSYLLSYVTCSELAVSETWSLSEEPKGAPPSPHWRLNSRYNSGMGRLRVALARS